MDALKDNTLRALEQVICDSENLCNVQITQDVEKEILVITNELGCKTTMNCRFNSVGATICQVCKHINSKTLFSYEEDYTIGC